MFFIYPINLLNKAVATGELEMDDDKLMKITLIIKKRLKAEMSGNIMTHTFNVINVLMML